MTVAPLIPPDKVTIAEAGTAGAVILLLMLGRMDWRLMLLIFLSGEMCAIFLTEPIAGAFGWNANWYPGLGMALGFGGMYLFGALLTLLKNFQEAPLGLLARLLKAFRGGE